MCFVSSSVGISCVQAGEEVNLNTSDTPEEREKSVLGDPLHLIWQKPYCGVERVERRMFAPIAGSELKQRQAWLNEVASYSTNCFSG